MVEIKVKVCYDKSGSRLFIPDYCCPIGVCYSEGVVYLPDNVISVNYCGIPLIKVGTIEYTLDGALITANYRPYLFDENSKLVPLKYKINEETFLCD